MKVIRVGLLLLFAFSVLAFGAVEVWSQSLLEIGASILLISWAVIVYRDKQSTIRWNPLNWPLLGFIAVGIVQLAFHWTPNPFLTRLELLRLAAYFIIFFLTAQAFRERADFVKLAWFLIVLGFSVALLGIIQHFTSEGTIYWSRQLLQGGDVFGPYVNRNHFAGFIELVAPVGLSLLVFRGVRRDLFPMVGLLTIIPIGALILASFARRDCVLRIGSGRARCSGTHSERTRWSADNCDGGRGSGSCRTDCLVRSGNSNREAVEHAGWRCDRYAPRVHVSRRGTYFP